MVGSKVKCSIGDEEDNKRTEHAVEDGVDEYPHIEEEVKLARQVELRVAETVGVVHILIKGTHGQDGQCGEEEIIAGDEDGIEDGLGTVAAEEGVPEVGQGEGEVLVEEVAEELGHPDVGPPAVDEQQPLEILELADGVVRRQDSLHSFLS